MLDNKFLHMQLISKAKTNQSLLKVSFPEGFSLSTNVKHCSNEKESLHEFLRRYHLTEHPARMKELWVWKQKSPNDVFLIKLLTKLLNVWEETISWLPKFSLKWHIYFNRLTLLPTKLQKALQSRYFLLDSRGKSA